MKVVAYADLGGLGLKQGAPVVYDWVAPSAIPRVLPWVAILALLLLKPNRCASAWWIWVPLALVGGVASAPESVLGLLPPSQLEMFLEVVGALGFGVAAVWLLSSYLGWKHRMLAFLGVLLALGVFSLLAYMIGRGWGEIRGQTVAMVTSLAASALVISVALTLAGLLCRGRYGGARLSLWLVGVLIALWLLVIGPFFVVAVISSGGRVPLLAVLPVIGVAVGISFGVMLPFLVLCFVNGFYRERLKGLLHLGAVTAPPPVIPPAIRAVPEVAAG